MFVYIRSLADLRQMAQSWKDVADKEQADFIAKLNDNPMRAMEWSTSMFEQVPRGWIATWVLKVIDDRATDIEAGESVVEEIDAMRNIREHALRNTLSRSQRVSTSSSTPHNMIEAYETAAWSNLYGMFGSEVIA